jgi:hypothetical protein
MGDSTQIDPKTVHKFGLLPVGKQNRRGGRHLNFIQAFRCQNYAKLKLHYFEFEI